ncbi:PQQ-like beta-propeller repeat protein [Kitasatospora aureofaciens]|nr:PQQ-like beta-propeller repeat protein [Kitasatospora aureofaciens]
MHLDGSLVVGEGCRLHILDTHDGRRRLLVLAGNDARPHLDSGQVCFLGLNKQINTFDLHTGRQHRWDPRHRLHEGMTSVSRGTAFTVGPDGSVTALDLLRRHRRWTMKGVACEIVSAPRVSGGDVFGLGCTKRASERGVDCVAALHEEDGSGRWLSPTASPLSGVWSVTDDAVYVIEMPPPHIRLVALDSATGARRWESDSFDGTPADLTAAGETVFLRTTERQLHAVDTHSGRTRWSAVGISRPPTMADGRVLLVRNARMLLAVDPATGQDVWPRRPSNGTLLIAPLVTDGAIYTIGHTGLTARNAATGRALGSPYNMSLSPDDHGTPVMLDGVLYFTNARREVEAVCLN